MQTNYSTEGLALLGSLKWNVIHEQTGKLVAAFALDEDAEDWADDQMQMHCDTYRIEERKES